MIVVDTNLIAYLWLPGSHTATAERVVAKDSDWCSPLLWRSEFRNVLCSHMRVKHLDLAAATQIMTEAENHMGRREYAVPSSSVLRLAAGSKCSAYDCEFVALAEELGVPLLTTDRKLAAQFPGIAVQPDAFLAAR